MEEWFERHPLPIPVFFGMAQPKLRTYIETESDFLYVDHAYWDRGPERVRIIRGATHLTKQLDRPGDRPKPELQPWRKDGNRVVVIPPTNTQQALYGGTWLETTLDRLSRITKRPIWVKRDKSPPLRNCLGDIWAVVTFGSVAGVEAVIGGVPVFSGPQCPTLPVSAGELKDIESPLFKDREGWLNSLSYANWNMKTIDRIQLEDYHYSCA